MDFVFFSLFVIDPFRKLPDAMIIWIEEDLLDATDEPFDGTLNPSWRQGHYHRN